MEKKLIVLVSGKLQSGKNQFAEYLKQHISKRDVSIYEDLFALGVKNGCKEDFAPLVKYLNENTDIKTTDDNWYENKTELTRILLQLYGTDIFRKRVSTDWWVKKQAERIVKNEKDVTIITDVRFPNEIDKLLDYISTDYSAKQTTCTFGEEEYLTKNHLQFISGCPYRICSVRINRNSAIKMGIKDHESETALDNYENFNYIYENNGTLDDLNTFAEFIAEELMIDRDLELAGL